MAQSNGAKTETSVHKSPKTSQRELSEVSEQKLPEISEIDNNIDDKVAIKDSPEHVEDAQDIDEILNSLKTLLSTLEKLQKVRQEVGDIKPLLGRMLDGELVAGEELEQVKTGVTGLVRLVRAYSDHQAALTKAQPARNLLDQVLKEHKTT